MKKEYCSTCLSPFFSSDSLSHNKPNRMKSLRMYEPNNQKTDGLVVSGISCNRWKTCDGSSKLARWQNRHHEEHDKQPIEKGYINILSHKDEALRLTVPI